eukprot:142353_1
MSNTASLITLLHIICIVCSQKPDLLTTHTPQTHQTTNQNHSQKGEKLKENLPMINIALLVVLGCLIIIVFLICYKIKYLSKKQKHFKAGSFKTKAKKAQSYDWNDPELNIQLLSIYGDVNLVPQNEQILVGEDIDDQEIDDAQLYAKPTVPTKGDAHDKDFEIIHFYYMDYEQQNDNEFNYSDEPYHERQKWEMCLMHSLNCLLQEQKFTMQSMNEICKQLAPDKLINPHKSVLNTGNYDANVLMMALNKMSIDVQWFDARKANELDLNDEIFLKFLQPDNQRLVGFILNNPLK